MPFDIALHTYFKQNKQLGSTDRKTVSEWAISLIRWKGLLSAKSWEERLREWQSMDLEDRLQNPKISNEKKASMPRFLFEKLIKAYGEEEALKLAFVCNERAPVTLRTNTLKISREDLLKSFEGAHPTKESPWGITLEKNQLFHSMEEFKKGFFEIQDEGSQLLAKLVNIKPGMNFLDYCAGSGGKSLAVAMQMEGKGQLYYHDIRERPLQEAKKRFKRAGVQNGQVLNTKMNLKRKIDWVLVDVPCSGTGTLRRNPDQKWRLTPEMLDELRGKQRNIFEKALSFVKPGGHIVYSTCSLLPEENEEQVEHFLKTYPVKLVETPFKTIPTSKGMDGFFGALFQSDLLV